MSQTRPCPSIATLRGSDERAQISSSPQYGEAGEFVPIGRIDADGVALRLQGGDRLFHMRKGRIGQAAEIDHIGAVRAHGLGARHHLFDGQGRRIDDFGEDAHRMAREIRRRSPRAR